VGVTATPARCGLRGKPGGDVLEIITGFSLRRRGVAHPGTKIWSTACVGRQKGPNADRPSHRINLDQDGAQATHFARAAGRTSFSYNRTLTEWRRNCEA
jgi:hypothetical protein